MVCVEGGQWLDSVGCFFPGALLRVRGESMAEHKSADTAVVLKG